jgi:4-hydroxy-4-methyl-2-oxoglutarate aldolase
VISSSLLASAGGDRVSVIVTLEPSHPAAWALGTALTVQGVAGDNLALHHAVAQAAPDEVIVVSVGGQREIAHCGEIVAAAAKKRGVAAIVLDGAIRDRSEIVRIGVPVFHLGVSPRGPGKAGPGALRVPIEIDGVRIEPGDLVSADADGVAIVPAALADEVLAFAAALQEKENRILEAVWLGDSTVDIFRLKELG